MRPLLGLILDPEKVTPEEAAALIHDLLAEVEGPDIELSLITTEAELAGFQAGHLVLYRKPVRKSNPRDVSYRRDDGTIIKREQTTLFDEKELT